MTPTRHPVVCVDLDGTLIAGDVFWESLLLLARRRPWILALLPYWLVRGKAFAKRQVALRVTLDPTVLPYRPEVLAYLSEMQGSGRRLVLATASDEIPARSIASHLGLFADVVASNGHINLSGHTKAQHLVERYGAGGFDYLGNGTVDIPAWLAAGRAIVAGAPRSVVREARRQLQSVNELTSEGQSLARAIVRAMRPVQWIKNLLVFVPLITSHQLLQLDRLSAAVATFIAFCCAASAVYVCNDLLDIQADRQHPRKRFRPFAAGVLSIPQGVLMSALLTAGAAIISLTSTTADVFGVLLLYVLASTLYSVWIKKHAIFDVFLLTGLYVLRVFAGGLAAGVVLSTWLLGFALFLFLSLALLKRYTELAAMEGKLVGRGYSARDEPWLLISGIMAAYMSAVVLALYVASPDVQSLYESPRRLWGLCPLMLMWFSKIWLNASRRTLTDDPIREALTDPLSWTVFVGSALILLSSL